MTYQNDPEWENMILLKVLRLKNRVAALEAELERCFEVMTERQIAEYQSLSQQDIQIPDSATNKKAEE